MKKRILRSLFANLLWFIIVPAHTTAQSVASFGFAFGAPEQRMSIENFSSYPCGIVADGQEIPMPNAESELMPPNSTMYDNRRSQTNQQQIPIFALCYMDTSETTFVGVATNVFQLINNGYGSTNCWIFRNSDILPFDGHRLPNAFPASTKFLKEKVKMPKEGWDGLAIMQVINNSHKQVHLATNKGDEMMIAPGGWYPIRVRGSYDRICVTLTAIAKDPSGKHQIVGLAQADVYAQYYNIVGQNLVLNDKSFN